MASRYPTTPVLDYCINPVRLSQDGFSFYVPCGKCSGCLLHKANEWSMRLGCEIEDTPFPIFFTFTYTNKFLPTCRYIGRDKEDFNFKLFTPDHEDNIRFAGFDKDNNPIFKKRQEDFLLFKLPSSFNGIPATNYVCDVDYFAYSSKRDFQLYLKLLRKDLYETFSQKTNEQRKIKYFCISEYGETLLRPHLHVIVLAYDEEVSEYLLKGGLFKSWQMCDRGYFDQNCHLCDSGAKGYVTQYLTCFDSLPQVYKDDRIKPWRLSSKNPAIGYMQYDEEKVFEDIVSGTLEYSKDISRLNERFVLAYPKAVGTKLFPKCYEYRQTDFYGLLGVYGLLWFLVRQGKADFTDACARLRKTDHVADYTAAKTCFKVCLALNIHPFTYVYALDMYYYLRDMMALRNWYKWQESKGNTLEVLRSYNNLKEFVDRYCNFCTEYQALVTGSFFSGFYIHPEDLYEMEGFDFSPPVNMDYVLEVEDIVSDMVKLPKFNEKFGFSPNSNQFIY